MAHRMTCGWQRADSQRGLACFGWLQWTSAITTNVPGLPFTPAENLGYMFRVEQKEGPPSQVTEFRGRVIPCVIVALGNIELMGISQGYRG